MNNLLSPQVPWTDLRYLFGEIMYGGHITDDWDRRLCRTYLEEYMKAEMVSILYYQTDFVLACEQSISQKFVSVDCSQANFVLAISLSIQA